MRNIVRVYDSPLDEKKRKAQKKWRRRKERRRKEEQRELFNRVRTI